MLPGLVRLPTASVNRRAAIFAASSVIAGLALSLVPCARVGAEQTGNRVEGGKVKWTGLLDKNWIGGSEAKLREEAAAIIGDGEQDVRHRGFLQLLQEIAKGADAFFVHRLDGGTKSGTPSEIKVELISADGNLHTKDERLRFWEDLREAENDAYRPGTITKLESDVPTITAGAVSYRAIFRIEVPDGSAAMVVHHIISRGNRSWHRFRLRADSERFRDRYAEFQGLLQSIKYQK
jgi:hypothetical protein